MHIGDGATDLEACPPANAFIGINFFSLLENNLFTTFLTHSLEEFFYFIATRVLTLVVDNI